MDQEQKNTTLQNFVDIYIKSNEINDLNKLENYIKFLRQGELKHWNYIKRSLMFSITLDYILSRGSEAARKRTEIKKKTASILHLKSWFLKINFDMNVK